MATLPPTRGRRRRTMGHETQKSKGNSVPPSTLPSWCSGFRKESLDSERAYDERVTTSTKTSEIRLRQESVRYWNRFLEEAEVAAFSKIVRPTSLQIMEVLGGDFGGRCGGNDDNEDRDGKKFEREVREINGDLCEIKGNEKESNDGDTVGDWEYCQQMFGLSFSSKTDPTSMTAELTKREEETLTSSKKSKPLPPSALSALDKNDCRIRYPFEVLPVFVISSPLISNCMEDRSKICHSMWKQLNAMGTQESLSGIGSGDRDNQSDSDNVNNNERNICIYLPRLLSSLTETLQVLLDGLFSHYENTHDAPSMDPDDPRYYSNPNDLASKRHSYHVSKRRHYEALIDRKVTTESQKSKIGTKKQQSLQDFILEFLQFVYEEPEDLSKQGSHEQKKEKNTIGNERTLEESRDTKRERPRNGKLIVLLEDARILHSKVSTTAGQGSVGGSSNKPNNSRLVQSQLLETLASWREVYGIPVSLVVFNSVGSKHEIQQNNVLLNPSFESSASGGRFGVQTIRCTIPSSMHCTNVPASMAFGVWSHFFLQATMTNPLPLMAPQRYSGQHQTSSTVTEIVLRMCRDALQNESSCSKWVSSIRARLVLHFYTLKGSFVWDALNPNAAAMITRAPILPEIEIESKKNSVTNNNTSNSNGSDKDRNIFVTGNDDVEIFQPGFVAWFCSYYKAHSLLSSQAGEEMASMTLSDKCDALLECYRLLLPPTKSIEGNNLEEKPLKRRKFSNGEYEVRDTSSGGKLHFWWSISCSLLPLYFLSLAAGNEELMLSSTNEIRMKRNYRQLRGESRWILERLAEVYTQLLSEERNHRDEDLDDANYLGGNKIADKMEVEVVESGVSMTREESSVDSIGKEFGGEFSEKKLETYCERGLDQDFVEGTLRRYLQRGAKKRGNDRKKDRDSPPVSGDATTTHVLHQESTRQLTKMVQETIVLVAAFSTNDKNATSFTGDKENELMGGDEIRSGMTETILKMNLLALGQVEAWTRQWVQLNPLMVVSSSEQTSSENYEGCQIGNYWCDNVNQQSSFQNRPINFRRRILDNLPIESRRLYEALEGRLSINRDDWFNSFDGSVEDFIIGLWALQKCGLIQSKKAIATTEAQKAKKRQDVVSYEKVAVVWC